LKGSLACRQTPALQCSREQTLSFTFVEDVAFCVEKLLRSTTIYRTPGFRPFNIACEEGVTVAEFLDKIAQEMKCPTPIQVVVRDNAHTFFPSVERSVPLDIYDARSTFGFQPTTLDKAIELSCRFCQEGVEKYPEHSLDAALECPKDVYLCILSNYPDLANLYVERQKQIKAGSYLSAQERRRRRNDSSPSSE